MVSRRTPSYQVAEIRVTFFRVGQRLWGGHSAQAKSYDSDLAIPHISGLLESKLERLLAWADHLVITQKAADSVMKLVIDSELPAVNLIGLPELSNRTVVNVGG
jgi:hypothetical protein